MKKVLAVLIALIVGLAAGFAGGIYFVHQQEEPKATIDVQVLKEEIKDVAELATCQETYTMEVPYTGEQKKLWKTDIKIPLTGKSMVVEYNGILKLGLKLTDDNYDVKVDDDTVTVTIPHSEILSHEIDEDSWVLKDKKNGLFNPLSPEDDNKLRKYAKKEVLNQLDMDKLYQEADENAQAQIEKFLQLACPDSEIIVEFK